MTRAGERTTNGDAVAYLPHTVHTADLNETHSELVKTWSRTPSSCAWSKLGFAKSRPKQTELPWYRSKPRATGAVAGYGGDIISSQNTPRTARDCEMTACGCTRRIGTNRARYFARESDKVLIFLFDG